VWGRPVNAGKARNERKTRCRLVVCLSLSGLVGVSGSPFLLGAGVEELVLGLPLLSLQLAGESAAFLIVGGSSAGL
jgi:hypothetical protein